MVKVKQFTGENNGTKEYIELAHAEGMAAYGGDAGELCIDGVGGKLIAGYASGHWASFTIETAPAE